MKKFKLSNDEVAELSNAPQYQFPKYVTQVINLVNSNAGGTRPKVVGQMSELIKEFDGKTISDWINGILLVILMLLVMLRIKFGACMKQ